MNKKEQKSIKFQMCLLLPISLKNHPLIEHSSFESVSFYTKDTLKSLIADSPMKHFVHMDEHINFFIDMDYFLSQVSSSKAIALSFGVNKGDAMVSLDQNNQIKSFDKISLHTHDGYNPMGLSYFAKGQENFLFSKNLTKVQGIPLPTMKKKDVLRPALFLDRDGVIIHDYGYVHLPNQVSLYEEVIPLIQYANKQNWWVFVVSNQSGVGRGKFSISHVVKLHKYLQDILESHNAFIDDWYYCPFYSKGVGEYKKESLLRKPNPGMILKICEKYPVDLKRSFMVGDNISDEINLSGLKGFHIKRQYDLNKAKWPIFSCYKDILQALKDSTISNQGENE